MTIGFDGSRAFVSTKTGTENYSYQLLKALAKIDNKNEYIVYVRPSSVILNPKGEGSLANASISNKLRDSSASPQNDRGVWPKNFQFKEIKWPRFWTQGGLAFQTFKEKPDVLFVPSHTLPLIRRPGLKTVVTVHDLGAEYLPKMHQVKQRLYLKWITNFQLKNATKLIAVSNATKQDLVKKVKVDQKRIEVIYEGYDKEKFKVQSSKFKDDVMVNSLRYYNLQPKTYFLFVGTVQPRKNLERLIIAFSKWITLGNSKYEESIEYSVSSIKDKKQEKSNSHYTLYSIHNTNLVIVGSKGWLSDEIYKLPKKLGIADRVKFLGYVPDKDLPVLYSGAIALVFPSLFEGFGLPILEAQACGCPVITSNVSSMPEVGGKAAIYVDPYNVKETADAMIRVKGKALRVKLIQNGLENIKRFSWEKCARETLKVFEEVIR